MPFRRFYRYDFASTQVFVEMATKYFGISISAHILSYTPTSAVQLLNEVKKPFFVDPMTFVFARNIDNISRNGKVRKSYRKLADDYGPPFSDCISGGPLTTTQFRDLQGGWNDNLISDITKRVLSFEMTKCRVPTSFPKYAKLLMKGALPQPMTPSFLVAPYFYAERFGNEWYQISLRFANCAKSLAGETELYPVICISRDILWDQSQIASIVNDYAGFDGYLIWVSDLDERTISDEELKGLRTMIEKMNSRGKPVYSIYGGYLCDLLRKFGLTGYSSGICYGEDRSVDARGGGAGNRYYVPAAHLKISEDLANAFLAESDRNLHYICSCPTCSNKRSSIHATTTGKGYVDLFFMLMEFLDFRRHFVDVKFLEGAALDQMNNEEIAQSLRRDIDAVSNIDTFPRHPPELKPHHLRVWRTLFS